eukprot:COSAG02_NODE_22006_length_767_cov_0.902695_1_plen_127_part_00
MQSFLTDEYLNNEKLKDQYADNCLPLWNKFLSTPLRAALSPPGMQGRNGVGSETLGGSNSEALARMRGTHVAKQSSSPEGRKTVVKRLEGRQKEIFVNDPPKTDTAGNGTTPRHRVAKVTSPEGRT